MERDLLLVGRIEHWNKMEGTVVNEVVESGSLQYAVIAGLHTETGIERLVIAYPNEESLRDLIAAPSIIAAGFSSREEAAAGGSSFAAPAVGRQQSGSVFRRAARFIASSYGAIAASVIIVFSSRNAVSAVLRMALGGSL